MTKKFDIPESRTSVQVTGLVIALFVTVLIYIPGLRGGFLFDDYFNIVENPAVYIDELSFASLKNAAFSSEAGMLKRPIAMLSFALNGYFGGIVSGNLKVVNLVIHLLNGILVYSLTRLTLRVASAADRHARNSWWPLLIATLWLTAPINLTGVLYSVQRMTSLAALFTFAGLYCYLRLRIRQIAGNSDGYRIIGVLLLFTCLAALSKENGLLLPAFAGCYELTVLRFKTPNRHEKNTLLALYLLSCGIPFVALTFIFFTHPGIFLAGYEWIRDFTLSERLLTESRVLWLYIFLTLAPISAWLGMYHDDIALSHSLLSPVSTMPALVGLIALLVGAWFLRKTQPLVALGILLFLTGHAMESTIIPLEIAHEHRNYFPSYGIFLSIVIGARAVLQNRAYPVLVLVVIAFVAATSVRASIWGNPLDLALMEVRHHPLSPRSNYEAARYYTYLMDSEKRAATKKDYYLTAKRLYLKSADLRASYISGLLGAIWLDSLFGMPPDDNVVKLALTRLANQKITPSTSGNLGRLHACELSNQCMLSGELIYDLQLAAIGNPRTPRKTRVSLMSEASARALKLNRFQEAMGIAYDAVKFSPGDAQLGLNYVVLLIRARYFAVAKSELERISKLRLDSDAMQQYERLRSLLARLSNQTLVHS